MKEELFDRYKMGFTVEGDHPIEAVEWLLQRDRSADDKLVYFAYDANLWTLPMYSEWNETEHKARQKQYALRHLSDFVGEIWLDDVKIK